MKVSKVDFVGQCSQISDAVSAADKQAAVTSEDFYGPRFNYNPTNSNPSATTTTEQSNPSNTITFPSGHIFRNNLIGTVGNPSPNYILSFTLAVHSFAARD